MRPAAEGPRLVLALPKGRVHQQALNALRQAGLRLEHTADDRAMRIDAGDAELIVMRNADVPTYVSLGVADAGVVGKDVILESGADLFEPVDLGFAACRLSLIRQRGVRRKIERVASKYPRLSAEYLRRMGSAAEVVKLTGNVELACLSGLADAVVDVVQTGETLAVNDLEEVDVLLRSSARLVVNRAALKLKAGRLRPLIEALRDLSGA